MIFLTKMRRKKILYRIKLKLRNLYINLVVSPLTEKYPKSRTNIFIKHKGTSAEIRLEPINQIIAPYLDMLHKDSKSFAKIKLRTQKLIAGKSNIFNNYYKIPKGEHYWSHAVIVDKYWPNEHYSKLRSKLTKNDFKNDDYFCDILYSWEHGKHHALFDLACLEFFEKGDTNRTKIREYFSSWTRTTQLENNIHWMNGLIIAQRSINWLFVLGLENDVLKLDEDLYAEIIGELLHSADFVYANLEIYKTNNNHLISNLVFLILISASFPNNAKLRKYAEYSYKSLDVELTNQVFSDGVNFEASSTYHRYVTELLIVAFFGLNDRQRELKIRLAKTILEMLNFLSNIHDVDYDIPIIGDNYQTKVTPNADNNANNCNALLNVYQPIISNYINGFISNNDSSPIFSNDYSQEVKPSDYLTSGWLCCAYPNQSNIRVIFDTANTGLYGEAAYDASSHGHSDSLSFLLSVDGLDFIIDRGCPEYTGSLKLHNEYRATASHNTLSIDGRDQCNPTKFWVFERYVPIYDRNAIEDNEKIVMTGAHENFSTKANNTTHRRKIIYFKKNPVVSVCDRLTGLSDSSVNGNLYLHPSVSIKKHDDFSYQLERGHVSLFVKFNFENNCRDTIINIKPTSFSKDYGSTAKTNYISYSFKGSGVADVHIEFTRC